ncbi:MAG TPA: GFA family protein [Hyphomicrobiaceae bacterium]|nr:GFA family protein [Hyphomicrobiaceae bacterium]
MGDPRLPTLTGGCQCGAVRYALYAEPTNPHVCHCRMCQKAFGNYFAPFAGVPLGDFAWIKNPPGIFRSSEAAERGFCRDCGTPLTYHFVGKDRISVSLGSLDDPARVPPAKQFGVESRLPFLATLTTLPGVRTEEYVAPADLARLASRQHPDHPD